MTMLLFPKFDLVKVVSPELILCYFVWNKIESRFVQVSTDSGHYDGKECEFVQSEVESVLVLALKLHEQVLFLCQGFAVSLTSIFVFSSFYLFPGQLGVDDIFIADSIFIITIGGKSFFEPLC